MKYRSVFEAFVPDLELLVQKSPMTAALRDLLNEVDFRETAEGRPRKILRAAYKIPIVAATDPWADVEYQSLYLDDLTPDNRITLQEPPVKDPMVGVIVLKAARLKGQSGMVYCGTPEQLKMFAEKLQGFEKIADEENMDEAELLRCLSEAAEAESLKLIYVQLSPEHGGEDNGDD